MSRCQFLVGDVFEKMADIPDQSVDLLVTSPPFLALRSYLPANHPQKHLEIGSEATPAAYLSTLLALTREWRRILAPHGSICVELGDTYSGNFGFAERPAEMVTHTTAGRQRQGHVSPLDRLGPGWPLPKSLCGIPTLYAGSLAYGHNLLDPNDTLEPWRVRNLIVWHRPNPPVGALGDKVRPSTSYITVACTSSSRWFDLDAERTAPVSIPQRFLNHGYGRGGNNETGTRPPLEEPGVRAHPAGAPPLDCWIDGDVWTIPTAPYKGAHYATYPPALPRRLIRLMCPMHVCTVCGEPRRRITQASDEYAAKGRGWADLADGRGKAASRERNNHSGQPPGDHIQAAEYITLGWTDCGHNNYRRGHVLDPFAGSGTTLAAAAEQGRDATGIDLDPRNLDLARQRIGLFLEEPA